MPRHALQHSHTCLHLFTSTHSQNKVSLCPHRDIFTCTDITSGRVSQANTARDRQGCLPTGRIRQDSGYLHFPPSSGTHRLGTSA